MIPNSTGAGKKEAQAREKVAYIRHMLGELRGVAANEGADMLVLPDRNGVCRSRRYPVWQKTAVILQC